MEKLTVIVTVLKGNANVALCPEGVNVVIVDYNDIDPQELATCGVCGIDFHENDVNMLDYDVDTCVYCEKLLELNQTAETERG